MLLPDSARATGWPSTSLSSGTASRWAGFCTWTSGWRPPADRVRLLGLLDAATVRLLREGEFT